MLPEGVRMELSSLQIGDVVIRKASEDDAAEIANVHLNSWREAYRNLLPQEFLDQLPLTFKRRMISWKQTANLNDRALFVAEGKSGIVGFSVFAPPRETDMKEHGELGAIYLLEKFKGKGIGAALLRRNVTVLQSRSNWSCKVHRSS
jgi:ribosomal protein S18 acetylase RimI-like enzyme